MSPATSITNLAADNSADGSPTEDDSKKVSKFVIIGSDTELHFVYGPLEEYSYHADLVRRYCEANEIPSGWVRKPDMYEIYGETYRVRGGGWLEEKPAERNLRFSGYSTAYGGFDRQDILYLFDRAEPFADYKVEFEP
ncbi:MAG: hypothetical protein JSU74_12390 [Candidatus Zixiibacteriota bacterium]|nr:MAG: hypothetical protein JSU74_12390 [candidate division Zixibacteria bacterium]